MTAPKPVSPELLKLVRDLLYDEIWNDNSPPEQCTQLEGTKEHRVWKDCQHLLDGLTVRDFQVLVDKCLDDETERVALGLNRIQQLRAAAHPKTQEVNS